MAGESGQERTEPATPKRRLDARKKGTVAKSLDLTSSLVILGVILAMPTALGMIAGGFVTGFHRAMAMTTTTISFGQLSRFTWVVLQPSLEGLAILIGLTMILGTGITTAQVGIVISAEALNPSFAKMNPIEGVKRLFSAAILFEALKALAKTFLFGFLIWTVIQSSWNEIILLGYLPPLSAVAATGNIVRSMAAKVALFWLFIAGLDYFFQKKRIEKQLRMTKEEVKREMKESEQSPEMRVAIARKRRKMARGRMLEALKTADAVVTNPTHYAVAIKYDSEKSPAPIVVAKGADLLAAKIREIAKAHEVPIIPNPPLARALYRLCEVGDTIPNEFFQPVAEILAYVYRTIEDLRVRKATAAAPNSSR